MRTANRMLTLVAGLVILAPASGNEQPSAELLEFIGEWETPEVTGDDGQPGSESLWQRWLEDTETRRDSGEEHNEDS